MAAKDAKIKPILGSEFCLVEAISGKKESVIVVARNLAGWRSLIKLVTKGNLGSLRKSDLIGDENLVTIGDLEGCCFKHEEVACRESTFVDEVDEESYRILLAMKDNVKLVDIPAAPDKRLLRPDDFEHFSEVQKNNLQKIGELCEPYSIFAEPKLPTFSTPDGQSEIDYLRELCRKGWRTKIATKVAKNKHEEYRLRVLEELKVIELASLAGYFLIVQDFIRDSKEKGVLIGVGRGCFLPDSRVKMSNNSHIPISFVQVGDKVIDAFGKPQTVVNVLEYEIDEDILEIEFVNKKIIRCTKDHLFLTHNRKWVEAQYLTEEDDVVEV